MEHPELPHQGNGCGNAANAKPSAHPACPDSPDAGGDCYDPEYHVPAPPVPAVAQFFDLVVYCRYAEQAADADGSDRGEVIFFRTMRALQSPRQEKARALP